MNAIRSARAQLLVDCAALKANVRALAAMAPGCRVLCVVKADAYGVGAKIVVPALLEAGVRIFGVATLDEAEELRGYGAEVRLLSAVLPGEIPDAVAGGFTLPVIDLPTARLIDAESARQKRRSTVQLAVDSGMGRVGIPLKAARAAARDILALPNLQVTGLYSHFPKAEPGDRGSLEQIAAVGALAKELKLPECHIAASEGVLFFPEAVREPFNLVRLGLAMYGVMPVPGLKGVVKFTSCLAAVRECPAGGTVSYGRLHTLARPTRVGTVAAGYADGVPLALTNKGFFRVRGQLCPILGRVTMDYTMIDLSGVPGACVGDEVELFTAGSGDALDPVSWACFKRTHLWDVLCSISPRVLRCKAE